MRHLISWWCMGLIPVPVGSAASISVNSAFDTLRSNLLVKWDVIHQLESGLNCAALQFQLRLRHSYKTFTSTRVHCAQSAGNGEDAHASCVPRDRGYKAVLHAKHS